jgi:uncharacterized protein (DUF302 family)
VTVPDDESESGITTKLSARSVAETVARFRELLAGKGIRIFAVIDQREAARDAGLELRDTVLVIFGDPRAGTPVMVAEPMSAVDLPLKVLCWDDEGQTKVSYQSPASLAQRYGLAADLAAKLAGIDVLTDALVASD